MFDIGFAELVLLGVVGLLVIGPDRLPETIRTVSLWLNRLRRGFNDIKREVQQELHNDEVMRELRKSSQEIKDQADKLGQDLSAATTSLQNPSQDQTEPASPVGPAAPKPDKKDAE